MTPEHPIPLRIGPDVPGSALTCDGTVLELVAPRAYPPGQPLQLTLMAADAPALTVAGRSIGSKRRDDGSFEVRVRLINLTRLSREALTRLFAPAAVSG